MAHLQDITACPFEKTNLVTQQDKNGAFDTHTCSSCKAVGKRYGLSNQITMSKKPACAGKFTQKKIKILDDRNTLQFGLTKGEIHETVPLPEKRFVSSTWVFSAKRKEAVRLLSHEYEVI